MHKIDITDLTQGQALVVREESDEEQAARIAREQADHALRLEKERVTFYAAGALYVLGLVAAFGLAVHSTNSEVSKWAMSLVTLLAGGLAGYFSGRQSK